MSTASLSELVSVLPGLFVAGPSAEVSGVTHDSRRVKPGDLFACLTGLAHDGHDYALDALARGALALLVDQGKQSHFASSIPMLISENTRRSLPFIASRLAHNPSAKLTMVGVTGTNGKTTTARLVGAMLAAAGLKSGTIGTLGSELMGDPIPSDHTTPESTELQTLLAEMLRRGAQGVAMEVSSHALAQFRTDAVEYDLGVFTNLTQDHLDYHKTMEAYFEAKLRLFTDYAEATSKDFCAVVNLDDPYGIRILGATPKRKLSYALNSAADVRAESVTARPTRLTFTAQSPIGPIPVELGFGGSFQVYNALAAVASGVALGFSTETISIGLRMASPVPGRFEAVPNERGIDVIVDYAHTPDGLKNLLTSSRQLGPKRIIVVFGCGGDRDRTKRPLMGGLASELADIAIVTSDNPRTEDPQAIIADILPGMSGTAQRHIEADRKAAIALAVSLAQPGDLVVIAGKGHEDYQIVGTTKFPFDDRQIAHELLQGAGR